MEKQKVLALAIAVIATAVYLLVPACGSQNRNNNPPVGYNGYNGYNGYGGYGGGICSGGIPCTGGYPGGVMGGAPLLNGPSISSLDYQGSILSLTYAAPAAPGQAYSGSVQITGTLHLAPGACVYLPAGDYPVQGTGTWVANYGGAVAGVEAQLQVAAPMGGAGVAGTGLYIYAGSVQAGADPLNQYPVQVGPAGTGYYMTGQVAVSACGRTFTAL